MRFFLSIVGAAILALSVGFSVSFAEDDTRVPSPSQAAPEAPEPPPAADTSAQRSGQLWVCCDDGRERWTATNEVCRQRKGQLLPSRFCERPKFVCCKQGRAEWWMPNADSCHADGGVVADKSYCR
jgi:hypothetical protein